MVFLSPMCLGGLRRRWEGRGEGDLGEFSEVLGEVCGEEGRRGGKEVVYERCISHR